MTNFKCEYSSPYLEKEYAQFLSHFEEQEALVQSLAYPKFDQDSATGDFPQLLSPVAEETPSSDTISPSESTQSAINVLTRSSETKSGGEPESAISTSEDELPRQVPHLLLGGMVGPDLPAENVERTENLQPTKDSDVQVDAEVKGSQETRRKRSIPEKVEIPKSMQIYFFLFLLNLIYNL